LALKKYQKSSFLVLWVLVLIMSFGSFGYAAAPPGSTTAPYRITYTAKLTDTSSVPIITSQSVRFSLWTDSDWDAGDIDGGGNINTLAPGYAGWQETHTVTPNADGIFTVDLGSITTFPNFTSATHVYLEVDVKPSAAPATAFEVLDPDGNTANTTDRKSFNSSPYAINADTVDNRDADNSANNIPVLDGSGKLIYGVVPDSVYANTFTLDFDNNSPSNIITLQFGGTVAEFLRWNNPVSRFDLSDSLNIDGDLSFTGTGNITGSTIDGSLNTLLNIPNTAIAPYAKLIRLIPQIDGATLQGDGLDNNGTMRLLHEDAGGANKRNYYEWTTGKATAQDMDIIIKYQLPTDFVAFTAAPLTLSLQTQDGIVANNKLDLQMYDSTGAAVTLIGATGLTSASAWTDQAILIGGAPTFTPGTFITFDIKTTAINTGKYVWVGDLLLSYTGR
jgi:hypothetical protein